MVTLTNQIGREASWNLKSINDRLQTSLMRLSSGLRINAPQDGAHEYIRAKNLESDIRIHENIKTGMYEMKSILELANNAAAELRDKLEQMKEKADLAKNETDSAERGLLWDDFMAMKTTVENIVDSTKYEGEEVLKEAGYYNGALKVPISVDGTTTMDIDLNKLDVTTTQGDGIGIQASSALDWADVAAGQARASTASDDMAAALSNIDAFIAETSTYINELDSYIRNSENTIENLTAARSSLIEVDVTDEMVTYTALDVTKQAATAVLAQANVSQYSLLELLQFD